MSENIEKKPVKRVMHSPDIISAAIASIKAKESSIRVAALKYGIPLSTLHDKLRGKRPLVPHKNTLLLPEEEDRLANCLIHLAHRGFGKTHQEIRETAKAIMATRNASSESKFGMPSTQWLYGFLKRHPELTTRTPLPLGKERATVTAAAVERWFVSFKACIDGIDPTLLESPERIFNADETGFCFDAKSRRVVAHKGSKHVYNVTSKTKTQVTVLACASAVGQYTPPMLIYPYKRIPNRNLLEEFPEAHLQVSDNGWINAGIFHSWLRDSFIPSVQNVKKPVLLLVDGHTSHTSQLETSELCSDNDIILYCLLANASHLMQPLDQVFFGAIKSAWSDAIRKHVNETGEGVKLESFAKVLKPVWDRIATPEIASKSFQAAGICPFNPGKVIKSKKLGPSLAYSTTPVDLNGTINSVTESTPEFHQPENTPDLENQSQNLIPLSECQGQIIVLPPLCFKNEDPLNPQPSTSALDFENEVTLNPQPTKSALEFENDVPIQPLPSTSSLENDVVSTFDDESRFATQQSTSTQISVIQATNNSKTGLELNSRQLKALMEYTLFVSDDISKKHLLSFFSRLANNLTSDFLDPREENDYKKFKELSLSLLSACEATASGEQVPKASLSVDDILKIPNFASKKGKGKKRKWPSMPNLVSGDEFREALRKKIKEKEEIRKRKVDNKHQRDEIKKKKQEMKEYRKVLREKERKERQSN
ncbi:uncharacterized protein LOC131927669 [Physella acuta]|uniref:uncharacterized protein LOC131927669 n=1 Tax=Physella acuta TaxID=109671 RepID=UPI0027DB944F|nr:uncharacterized protein LOC131927669 [Physella acuta]